VSGRKRKKANQAAWYESAWLTGLLLMAVAVYAGLSLTGDPGQLNLIIDGAPITQVFPEGNPGGPVGSVLNVTLSLVFGMLWCWAFPVLLAVSSFGFLFKRSFLSRGFMLKTAALWLVTATWMAQEGGPFGDEAAINLGGVTGSFIARGFHGMFGLWGGRIFLTLFLLVIMVLIFRPWLGWVPDALATLFRGLGSGLAALGSALMAPLRAMKEGAEERRQTQATRKNSTPRAEAREPEPEFEAEEAAGTPTVKERTVHNIPEADSDSVEDVEPYELYKTPKPQASRKKKK
jgi:hypothetical protein